MSEYQFIAFRAVDRPLDDRQLEFAEQQSSRAKLSRWEMSVEYHYSEFRGDVDGLLQRGFDVFLQYTNYGTHEIRMRLPQGLPLPTKTWKQFVDGERLSWKPDRKGKAGILRLCPFIESGQIEQVWDFDSYLDGLVGLREQLITGDPRPLYAMWLCASTDDYLDPDKTSSPSVPAGLSEMTQHASELLDFYGLDPLLLLAAGEAAVPVPDTASQSQQLDHWVGGLSKTKAKELLTRFLTDDPTTVKAEVMAEIRDCHSTPTWPLSPNERSLEDLISRAKELRSIANKKAAKKAAAAAKRKAAKTKRERQARMKKMLTAPKQWLSEADKLADARGTSNYEAAADILADLQEAIGGTEGKTITRKHAAHLAKKHPTLNRLKSSLRKRGLLD
jgi:hypothetical protein